MNLCLCEGLRACRELFRRRPELIKKAFCTENFTGKNEFDGLDFSIIGNADLKELSATVSPQGIILLLEIPESANFAEFPFCLILDQISDPGNLGTIFRTAMAVGAVNIVTTKGTASPWSDKVIRSGLASQFFLNIKQNENLEEAIHTVRSEGYQNFFRLDPHSGENVFECQKLFEKSALILGGEAHGAEKTYESQNVKIPMPGNFESLNVAQAATVSLFEYLRRIKNINEIEN